MWDTFFRFFSCFHTFFLLFSPWKPVEWMAWIIIWVHVLEPTGTWLLRYFGTRDDITTGFIEASLAAFAALHARKLVFFDSRNRPIIKTSFYLWRDESFTGRYLRGLCSRNKKRTARGEKTRKRFALVSEILASVKLRSGLRNLKRHFIYHAENLLLHAMLSLGCSERFATKGRVRLSKTNREHNLIKYRFVYYWKYYLCASVCGFFEILSVIHEFIT